jgi:DNA-binding GntR family transcriptional regulator
MATRRATAQRSGRQAPRAATPHTSPYETLKKAILSGEFTPGQPMAEVSLAEWCAVSRTPIREALGRLEQDGLVHRNDRGVVVVRERSPQEIIDIYDTRLLLEANVGRFAAERRTELDIRLLRRLLEVDNQLDVADPDAMADANRTFHRAVWRASHNESLLDLLERLNLHLARYPGTTLAAPGRWHTALEQHAELVTAIENRDTNAAHDIALKHFQDARDIRLDLFATETAYQSR